MAQTWTNLFYIDHYDDSIALTTQSISFKFNLANAKNWPLKPTTFLWLSFFHPFYIELEMAIIISFEKAVKIDHETL